MLRLYLPSLKEIAQLEDAQYLVNFSNFPYICLYFFSRERGLPSQI